MGRPPSAHAERTDAVRFSAVPVVVLASTLLTCVACAPPVTRTCSAGLYDAFMVGGAPSPTVALQRFLGDLEAQGMPPLATWRLVAMDSTGWADFRSGAASVSVALRDDGWEVTNYRSC